MIIKTQEQPWLNVLPVNSTAGSIVHPVITTTKPTGAGVIAFETAGDGESVPNSMHLVPFGAGAKGNTFVMQVWGWRFNGANPASGAIYQATNTTPIVIYSPGHNLRNGQLVTVTGVVGNTNANMANQAVTVIDANKFSLNGSAGNGVYVSGGTWTRALPIYVPIGLIEVTCTLCTSPGVTGAEIDNTNNLCDTIVQTSGWGSTPFVSNEVIASLNDVPSHIILDLKGCRLATFLFNVGTATSANCMVAGI